VRRARAPPSRESKFKPSEWVESYFFFAFFAVFFAFFAAFLAPFFAAMILLVPFSAFADPFCFRFVSCRFAGLALRTREGLEALADAALAGPPTPLPRSGEADRVLARGRGGRAGEGSVYEAFEGFESGEVAKSQAGDSARDEAEAKKIREGGEGKEDHGCKESEEDCEEGEEDREEGEEEVAFEPSTLALAREGFFSRGVRPETVGRTPMEGRACAWPSFSGDSCRMRSAPATAAQLRSLA